MMKLGLLTAPFPERDLLEVADWAAAAGFECLEIACWPRGGGEARRYAGTSHIDVGTLSDAQAGEIVAALSERGLTVSGLGYYPNPLHADAGHRERVIGHLLRVIEAAARMGVPVVNTFVGGDRTLPLEENWTRAEAILPDILRHARAHGVTLAFENCPMIFSQDEWPGGHNIAYSPKIWRRLLEWDGVRLNYDPSQMNALGAGAATLPGGHVEGFADTFAALFRQVYRDVAAGGRQPDSTWATFEDGHAEMLLCDAVLQSARDGRWVRLPA